MERVHLYPQRAAAVTPLRSSLCALVEKISARPRASEGMAAMGSMGAQGVEKPERVVMGDGGWG